MCLYVRELTFAEGRRLTRVLKTTKTAAYLRRAQVVAFSGQGMRAREIAGRLHLHEEYVRELIRRFNAGGFAVLRPRTASGRPSKYAPEEISVMLEVAGTRPPRSSNRAAQLWSSRPWPPRRRKDLSTRRQRQSRTGIRGARS